MGGGRPRREAPPRQLRGRVPRRRNPVQPHQQAAAQLGQEDPDLRRVLQAHGEYSEVWRRRAWGKTGGGKVPDGLGS